jgi:hypothetical protein
LSHSGVEIKAWRILISRLIKGSVRPKPIGFFFLINNQEAWVFGTQEPSPCPGEKAGEFIDAVSLGKWSFDRLSGTLAELHVNPIERGVEDVTIFKSVRAAYFDFAVAKGVFEKAKELNLGEEIFL